MRESTRGTDYRQNRIRLQWVKMLPILAHGLSAISMVGLPAARRRAVFGKSSTSPGFGFTKNSWGGEITDQDTGPKKSSTIPMEGGAFVKADSNRCGPLRSLSVAKYGVCLPCERVKSPFDSCAVNHPTARHDFLPISAQGLPAASLEGLSAIFWRAYPPQAWLARHQYGGHFSANPLFHHGSENGSTSPFGSVFTSCQDLSPGLDVAI